MTQITQRQINEAIRQAHIERSNAMVAGLRLIRSAIAWPMVPFIAAMRMLAHPNARAQN